MPRGLGAADLVERFYAAFNGEDLDAFAATLHPQVELQTSRGLREGREEARGWARRSLTGQLDQRLVLERIEEDDHGAHAVAIVRRQWRWREDGELALDEPAAALFTIREGLIGRWQPFADPGQALALLERLARRHRALEHAPDRASDPD